MIAPRQRRPRLPRGCSYYKGKIRAKVHVHGRWPSKMFRLDEVDEAEAWIKNKKQDEWQGETPPVKGARGTLGPDMARWLETQRPKPSYKHMKSHLRWFEHELGADRPTRSVTGEELNRIYVRWQLPPTKGTPPAFEPGQRGRRFRGCGLDKQTLRRYRATLKCFFDATVGPKKNPVLDAPRFPLRNYGAPRSVDYATVQTILAAMPDYRPHKPGTPPRSLSLAKLRATILAFTGLPPKMLSELLARVAKDPSLLVLTGPHPMMRVQERAKGEGVAERDVPLAPQAVTAFKVLVTAPGGLRKFGAAAVSTAIKRAARAAHVAQPVTAYWLRHSFGTELYRQNKDTGTVGRTLMHAANSKQTSRYTLGAHADVDRAAVRQFGAAVPAVQLAAAPMPPAKVAPRGGTKTTKRHGSKPLTLVS